MMSKEERREAAKMIERYMFRGKRVDTGEWATGFLINDKKAYILKQEEVSSYYISGFSDDILDTKKIYQ